MRRSGVLMPVSSLPSRFGIGGFSKEAYDFVDSRYGRFYRWDLRDMEIHRISLFQPLQAVRTTSVWMH